jgi:molybdopterin-guanine dinucleotide biosynthesis protein MobB
MQAIGIAGWSGSGKTSLIRRLIPELRGRGLSVSTIKHAHHAVDIDRPGKDSFLHREAGASEVLISSGSRWALMHELRDEPEPGLADLLARLSPVDLVLVEGFRHDPCPKLEVWRPETGKPPLYPADPWVRALITDPAIIDCTLPQFPPLSTVAIADFLLMLAGIRLCEGRGLSAIDGA